MRRFLNQFCIIKAMPIRLALVKQISIAVISIKSKAVGFLLNSAVISVELCELNLCLRFACGIVRSKVMI